MISEHGFSICTIRLSARSRKPPITAPLPSISSVNGPVSIGWSQTFEQNSKSPNASLDFLLPDDPSVAQAEDALTRERARLSANRLTLRNQQRVAEDRAKSRNDISQRLGELDLETRAAHRRATPPGEECRAIRAQGRCTARPCWHDAKQLRSEIELLRVRLALLSDRSCSDSARNRPRAATRLFQSGAGAHARGRGP